MRGRPPRHQHPDHEPPSGRGPASRLPPYRPTRSRIPISPGRARQGRRSGAVVGDHDLQLVGPVCQAQVHARARARVLEGVGQALLHDPVRREVDAGGHVAATAVDRQRDGQSRLRTWSTSSSRRASVGAGSSGDASPVVEQLQEPAQLGQALSSEGLDRGQGPAGRSRSSLSTRWAACAWSTVTARP